MPWTVKDVDGHKRGLTDDEKKRWVKMANGILKSCEESGGKNCEAKAIMISNARIGKRKKP